MFALAWWFDWLPHHGLDETQSENRYRATRNRVGMEWLFTPLMLSQNYHLVHHLHPSIPFYRYLRDLATQRGGIPRARRGDLDRLRQVARPRRVPRVEGAQPEAARRCCRSGCRRARAPRTRSSTACRSPRSTRSPTTARWSPSPCPRSCATQFRFEPGQHVTVRTDLGGEGVRRNYSICAPATRAMLRIAVKHIPGGAFSTFVCEQLEAGDVLEVMTPTGRFCTPLHPLNRKHYVAIVVGSGITPILSMLQTTLEIETESRFTLIYGNRTGQSTMFRARARRARVALRRPARDPARALRRDPHHTPDLCGRIDRDKLERWLDRRARPGRRRRVVPVRPGRARHASSATR